MNRIIALFLLALPLIGTAQKHTGKSGVKVVKTSTQSVMGRCLGYYVVFENKSNKVVDGIKWKATFTNNFGEVLGEREGMWQSGNFIVPMEPGETTEDLETNYVKGGLKIWITVTKVHFKEKKKYKMDSIKHNNKERTKQLGSIPATEMSKRERFAAEAMSSLIKSMNITDDSSLDEVAELAVKMADSLINKLN